MVGALVARPAVRHPWLKGREYLTHGVVAGLNVALTGVAEDHWMADLVNDLHMPANALHLWNAGIDVRWLAIGFSLALVVGGIALRRTRAIPTAVQSSPETEPDSVRTSAPTSANSQWFVMFAPATWRSDTKRGVRRSDQARPRRQVGNPDKIQVEADVKGDARGVGGDLTPPSQLCGSLRRHARGPRAAARERGKPGRT